jgi:hypothetical protein
MFSAAFSGRRPGTRQAEPGVALGQLLQVLALFVQPFAVEALVEEPELVVPEAQLADPGQALGVGQVREKRLDANGDLGHVSSRRAL